MISYFRSILPSRLFLLVILFLGIQLPLILFSDTGTVPELLQMLVGERMADGFVMYREIYDNTAPLSALLYWCLDLLAGRSYLTYRLTAMVLLLLQALLFNHILNRHQVYNSKNYLPALTYLILGSITFHFNLLSPLLIGNTFIIFSLPYIITVSREGFDNSRLFVGGFMIGLAALCYLPLALFLLLSIFAVIFFASSTVRSALLMLCGFAFPYAVLLTYYLYTGTLSDFFALHLFQPWKFRLVFIVAPVDMIKLLAWPAFILVLSVISLLSLPQRLVFQVKFEQVMWVWLLTAVVIIFTRGEISGQSFVLLLPPIAYFSEYFFTAPRKVWLLNLFFFLLLASVILSRYRQWFGINRLLQIKDTALYLPVNPGTSIKDKTILVLGDDFSYYMQNKPVTPYLNWRFAQLHFGKLHQYQPVFEIEENFRKEKPAYIIDKAGLMPALKYKLPAIFNLYELTQTPSVYRLR
ncbi:hypothetical protein [Pontibacter arcticus]|uniref:Glycosyltransferase RgtA/B/C/D-like domain-containing protein n=1 Tax=Pontibacter arcticus TaxID=2080288 RepID=A0A364RJ93_9BACT|nr:hypothetical protein [Pontibacter arcticus]RAU84296.1 hypothetical protein DP923_04445 [Pontibacter arcticus]